MKTAGRVDVEELDVDHARLNSCRARCRSTWHLSMGTASCEKTYCSRTPQSEAPPLQEVCGETVAH
jgi:hypothetical protein